MSGAPQKVLRMLAAMLALGSLIAWLASGANRGWTKTSVTTWQKDPVTEIEGPIIEKRLQPGIDLLALALLSAAGLFGASMVCFKTKTQPHAA
jgi:hypothetical protein